MHNQYLIDKFLVRIVGMAPKKSYLNHKSVVYQTIVEYWLLPKQHLTKLSKARRFLKEIHRYCTLWTKSQLSGDQRTSHFTHLAASVPFGSSSAGDAFLFSPESGFVTKDNHNHKNCKATHRYIHSKISNYKIIVLNF